MNIVAALPVDDQPLGAPGTAATCFRPGRERAGLPRYCVGYEERHPLPTRARFPASSMVKVTFGFEDPIAVTRSGQTASRSMSLVAGLHDAPIEVVLAGVQHGVALRCDRRWPTRSWASPCTT